MTATRKISRGLCTPHFLPFPSSGVPQVIVAREEVVKQLAAAVAQHVAQRLGHARDLVAEDEAASGAQDGGAEEESTTLPATIPE